MHTKKLLLLIFPLLCLQFLSAQTYVMTNGTVSTCSGTFYDPGGTGNYAINQNVTMTFCNPTPGQPIYVNFSAFNIENGFDYLYVYNGPNTGSPSLGTFTGAGSPGSLIASSGCITFLFTSDFIITAAGWVANISCTPQPCNFNPTPLCGVVAQPTSPNSANQGTVGCMFSTYNQTFYVIQPTTAGNLTYTIQSGCDVDFALWGPFATIPCNSPVGQATLDCSYSISATEYADIANAVPGQYYILLVSNFCNVATTINLTPSGSAAGGLNCGCNISATASPGVIACTGGTTSITVNATGQPSYIYTISPNPGVTLVGNTFSNVPAGNYTITVTSGTNPGCTTTTTANIAQPNALFASNTFTPILCSGGTSTITVTPSGGTPGYQYSLNGGAFQAGNTFVVNAGTHTITVRDANNCLTTTVAVVNQPANALTASNSFTPIACNGGTSTITVGASGGTPNYQYSLNGGAFQAGNTFVVAAGNHTITVQDANGCQTTTTANITEPALLTVTNAFTPIPCAGGTTDLTAAASGGTPNYQYSLNGGTFQMGNTFTGLGAGSYTISVQDTNGCTASDVSNIANPSTMIVSASSTAIACNGGTADITVSASGGTPNYQYSLDGSPYQASNLFAALPAGTYNIDVLDANNCAAATSITITEPTALVASASAPPIACFGGTTTITANGSGGTPAYQYSLNGTPFQASNTFTNIFVGNFDIVVSDANGCTDTVTLTTTQPAAAVTVSNVQELCNLAGTTYTVSFDLAGGTPGYSVTGVTGTLTGTSFVSNPIPTGTTPAINIFDANNCGPVTIIPIGNCSPAQPCNAVSGCYGSNLIVNGDFENFSPSNPFQFFTSNYDYYDCDLGNSPCVNGVTSQNILCQYDFAVETSTPPCNNTWSSNIADHTSGTGNMMLIDFPTGNVAPNNNIWCSQVSLLPNTDYCFGAYFLNLVPAGTGYASPVFEFQGNGITLGTTIGIPEDEQWHFRGIQFNSAAGGMVDMCILNNNFGFLGFDLAIDDIMIREVGTGTPPTTVNDAAIICDNISNVTIDVLSNDSGVIDPNTLQLLSYPAFSAGNGTVANGQIVFTPSATFSGSTSFTYLIGNGTGCYEIGTITVTEVAAPQPTITGTTNFCQGLTSVLDAGMGYANYDWVTPAGAFNTQTVTASASGLHIVTVTDANGCVGIDTASVNVNPLPTPVITTASTALCQGNSGILDAGAGYNTYSWSQLVPATALGANQTLTVNSANTYIVTVSNGFNCTGTDSIDIIVNPLPVVSISQNPANPVCPGTTATLSATTGYNAYSWFGTSTAVSGNQDSLVVNATDTYNVEVTDANGCQNQANIATLFQDLVPPVIQNCPANLNLPADPGSCTAVVTWAAPTATDNCSVSIVQTFGMPSGSAFPIGTSNITYTATDAGGNSVTCSFSITVTDNQPPIIVNCPNNFILNNTAGQCDAVATWTTPGVTDNCGASVVQSSGLPSGSTFPVGVSTVTYTATDLAGNTSTCSFTITVIDNESPVISNCPSNITLNNTPGLCTAVATWTAPVATDNCPGSVLAQTGGLPSGSVFPLGTSTISYTVTDAAGNTATCSFTVTVVDNEAPAFTNCSANINLTTTSACSAVATWTTPTATDNCGVPTVVQTQGPVSGSNFPIGTTTVSYLATDAAGNTEVCTFDVTVTDGTAPIITGCPANISAVNSLGQCGAIITWTQPSATDNCGSANLVQTAGPASGTLFPIGTTTVTYTATDAAGNVSTCQFTVTVTDNEAPTFANCPTNISQQATAGCDAVVNWIAPTATDNCSGATLTASHTSGSSFPIGTTTVTYTATDADGNTSTCTFDITITPPAAISLSTTINNATCNGVADGWATVAATGGTGQYSYSWATTPVQTSAAATNLPAGTYQVFVSDANAANCVTLASTTVTIGEPQPLVAAATALATADCGQAAGIASVTASGGSQAYTYTWATSPAQYTQVATGLAVGTYSVQVSDAANPNCATTTSVTITGNPSPVAAIAPTGTFTICEGQSLTLTAAGGNSYQWLRNGVPMSIGNPLSVSQQGSYQAIAYSGNGQSGCTDTSQTVVVAMEYPPVAGLQAEGPTVVCEGQEVLLTALGNGAFEWYKDGIATGQSSAQITSTSSGLYTVVVSNLCGVDTSNQIFMQFNPLPVADFIFLPFEGTVGDPVQFVDKSQSAASWFWLFGDGTESSTLQNPTYTYNTIDEFVVTLTVQDALGCSDTTSKTIRINPKSPTFIPNTFTPNGDGVHDEFIVEYNELTPVQFEIFDRWGNTVFVTQDPSKGWNGNNRNGVRCSDGTYYYVLTGKDYQDRLVALKGFIQLLR